MQTLTGPSINRHRSKQDYETPWEFIRAVEARFGMIDFDLAASLENSKAPACYTVEDDSLKQDWTKLSGNLWLNPPFNDIAPWARKCAESAGQTNTILLLTPASIGSNWFAEHVHGKAAVFALNPRLSFDGQHPYPKDCILSVYNFDLHGFDVWKWKETML